MLDVLFLANYKWVVQVLDETLELIMFIVIGYVDAQKRFYEMVPYKLYYNAYINNTSHIRWLFRLSRDNTLYFKIKVVRNITDKERKVITIKNLLYMAI